MLSEKRTLVRNTVLNGLAQFASTVVALAFMPLLVRRFGLDYFGLYVLCTAAASYVAVLDLGLGTALTRAVAEKTAGGSQASSDEAIGIVLRTFSVIGVASALILVTLALNASKVFGVHGHQAQVLSAMLLVTAVLQLIQWPAGVGRYALSGLQRYDVLSGVAVLNAVLGTVAIVAVVGTGHGPLALVIANALVAAASSLVTLWFARRLYGPLSTTAVRAGGWRRLKIMLAFSWGAFVVQLSDLLFYQQTDRLILGVLVGAVAVALYEASAKLNGLILYLSGLTVSAVLPLASAMDEAKRESSIRSLLIRGTKYGCALIVPTAVVVVALAEPLVVLWLGPRFAGQGVVMQVLIFPHILTAMGLMGDMIVISKGRMGPRVPFIVGQAILNVVLSVALVPRFGVIGVAIGTAVAHIVDLPFHARFLARETGVSARQWLLGVVLPVYPLLVVPAGACWLFVHLGFVRSLPALLLAAVIALVAYWVGFVWLGLPAWERDDLGAVGASLLRRAA